MDDIPVYDHVAYTFPTVEQVLSKCYKIVQKAVFEFKRQALNRKNVRYFVYYALANFLILLVYSYYQSLQPVTLDLKPVASPQTEGSSLLFLFSVVLLPLSCLFEGFAFRLMPMTFIIDIFHLNEITESIVCDEKITIVHNSRLRLWIYHHWDWLFIVVSAFWAGWLHQINIVNSDLLGSLIYFGVQSFSGISFAWLYAYRGFGASWAVHTAWDYFIVVLNLVMVIVGVRI